MNTVKNTVSDDPVLIRILDLLKEQNKTQKNLIDFLGVHPIPFINGNTITQKAI
jgi:hypothetical protein